MPNRSVRPAPQKRPAKRPEKRRAGRFSRWSWLLSALNLLLLGAGTYITHKNPDWWRLPLRNLGLDWTRRVPAPTPAAAQIVAAAKAQQGALYSAAYARIAYPGGDVAANKGACSDVVIRALRGAGYDLQKLMHEDIVAHWNAYPNHWGLHRPDPNIDHRRVPNQMIFLARYGRQLTNVVAPPTRSQWQPGDIVCWKTGPRRWHTGVLSDGVNARGWPLVVHNGSICVEADCLTRWPIIGHYRFPKKDNSGKTL